MSTGASAAPSTVCGGQGSPPSGFPSCVWSVPVAGGEALLDTVGTASASEVRQALAEGRAPQLSAHVLSDAEGALAVEALLFVAGSLPDVVVGELPTYAPPLGDAQVSVLGGTLEGPFGSSGQEAMFKFYFYNWGGGHWTIVLEFSEHNGVMYDSKFGWFDLM
ncbi:hypothetical protein MFUL124B02_09415 [Myxococcus fulvus 124B02]|nr:hypothetical protein MFUL124B02_09415 [Myxococcus fulvus 124B02]